MDLDDLIGGMIGGAVTWALITLGLKAAKKVKENGGTKATLKKGKTAGGEVAKEIFTKKKSKKASKKSNRKKGKAKKKSKAIKLVDPKDVFGDKSQTDTPPPA